MGSSSLTKRRPSAEAATSGIKILFSLGLSFLIASVDATIVNIAAPIIKDDLGMSGSEIAWVVNGYVLSYAAFLLLAGELATKLGGRRVYILGIALFITASALCGLSLGAGMLIAARVIQGISAALFQPASLMLLSAAFPEPKRRASMVGLWGAMGSFGAVLGPVIGGLLVGGFGWQSIFWINLPIGVIALALAVRALPNFERDRKKKIYPMGHLLAIAMVSTLALALMDVSNSGWTAWDVLVPGSLSIVLTAIFIRWQSRGTAAIEPIYPSRLFHNPQFSAAMTIGTLMNVGFYGLFFVFSFFLQTTQGTNVQTAGLQIFPLMFAAVIGNIIFTKLARTISTRVLIVIGSAIAAGSTCYLAFFLTPNTPYWDLLLGMSLANCGLGVTVSAVTSYLLATVDQQDSGTAVAMFNANRQIGSLIGVALTSSFLEVSPDMYMYASCILAAGLYVACVLVAIFTRPVTPSDLTITPKTIK